MEQKKRKTNTLHDRDFRTGLSKNRFQFFEIAYEHIYFICAIYHLQIPETDVPVTTAINKTLGSGACNTDS